MGEVFRKDLVIDLDDPKTIQDAIDAVNRLKDAIPEAINRMIKSLCEQGVTVARQNIADLCVSPTGSLSQSVRFEIEDGGKTKQAIGYVVAGYPDDHLSDNERYTDVSYAVFVEFGYGTANYYDTTDKLVVEQSRIDYRKEIGKKPDSGRWKEHKRAPANYYRSSETYGILKGADGSYYFGWKYMGRKGKHAGEWYTSHGQNPKPFMYKTLLELTRRAEADTGTKMGFYIYSKL